MYYLLVLLLFLILYYVFVKVLSSAVKGCLMALFVLLLISVITVFVKSTAAPVRILDLIEIYNFEVRIL